MPDKPVKRRKAGGEFIDAAFCPCCCKQVHQFRVTERIKGVAVEKEEYFSSIEWNPDQPFGLRRPTAGKASFTGITPIGPEDNPELFKSMHDSCVRGVRLWIQRGWIKLEELE
jgi:hypothetical protein